MSNPISSATQAPPVQTATPAPAPSPKAAPTANQPTPADSVKISNSAQALLQEVQETHSQTAQEAGGGDSQAARLLAKEAAATVTPKG